jgi:hypothetical protein
VANNLVGYNDLDSAPTRVDEPTLDELLRDGGSRLAQMAARGATVLTAPHEGDTGTPIGITPDSVVNGAKVVVRAFDGENALPTISFTVNGKNDPTIEQAIARAADLTRHVSSDKQVPVIMNAFQEIAAAQTVRYTEPAAQSAPARNERRVYDAPPDATVTVEFDFGPLGRMRAAYADAVIHDRILVLVAPAGSSYTPPVMDPGQTITVGVESLAMPVKVFSLGLCFPHRGLVYTVLPIDRDG